MALTLPANYISALGQGFQESWLVEISNTGGSGTTAYIRLGTEEVGSGSSVYHPFILNAPSIRESIDLEKGTSKTSNISIVCHNGTLANHSQSLSKEILNQGTRFYLNHQVTIKSKVGTSTTPTDWLTVFTGRLKDVKVNDNHQVTLSIASATPIDFVKIPQYQSNSGNFYPIVYGDYKNETSTRENPDHIDDDTAVKVFPVQVDRIAKNNYNCLVHTALTDEVLHYPLKDAFRNSDDYPIFAPIETSVNAGFLNEALDDSETGIDVSNGGNFSSGDIILIDREQMKVSSVSSNTLTVTRGFNSTTAAIHEIYSPVYIVQNAISSINTYESDTADTNRNVLQTSLNLLRTYRYRPSIDSIYEIVGDENVALDPFAPNETYPKENMVDTDTSSYHQFVHTATSTSTPTDKDSNDYYSIKLNVAKEEHYIKEYKVYVKFDITAYTNGFNGTIPEYEIMAQCRAEFASGSEVENGTAYDAIQTDRTETFVFSTDFASFDGASPTSVEVRFWFRSNDMDSSETSTSTIRVDDIWIETTAEIIPESDTNANPMEQQSAVTSIDTLYCGADGLTKSFSSGVVSNIVDMHRDLLSRFTGIAGSGATIRVNGGNSYSDLTTARSSWKCEYWTNKEEEVNDLLEKAQFEGGFIFRFRSSDENPQYIYIANGTPTADHIIDLEDISSFDLSMTPVDKLVTKRIIKYQRSPINDKHIKEQTSEDTTNSIRSNYNIQTNENIETNTLDILVGGIGATNTGTGNRNDGFANYYASINGKPKYIVGLEIINSQSSGASQYFYGMEVGDYCKFSTSVLNNLSTFGGIDTTTIFIVTDITRTLGSLKVTLRQI